MARNAGFTLVELIVVILIVGILAAVAVPILRGNVDKGKWCEANAAAGSIRTAVRAYIVANSSGTVDTSVITGSLDSSGSIYEELGFSATDLDGAYFNQADYTVSSVDAAAAACVVTVTSSHVRGPAGTGTLDADGTWSLAD